VLIRVLLIKFASMERNTKVIRVAILDLYEGQTNEGMRCIREILKEYARSHRITIVKDEFDVRLLQQVPDLSYDIYISSGGPGSPLESENSEWEKKYFHWLRQVENYNSHLDNTRKKHVLFICHSYQLACRYYHIAKVSKRRSTAFGVFPVHILDNAINEPVFQGLPDPFYAVDSRDYQVTQPNHETIRKIGASILAIEKERPHIPLERAIMAVRFNEYMIGTQFHPEADSIGMTMYLLREDKKNTVIENHGYDKWKSMIRHLNDPDKILLTYSHVIPNFLQQAVDSLQSVEA
jgi:GMP synthase-like glutamine amidotransferase